MGVQIRWSPEQEEPPHTVGHKLTGGKSPCLLVCEALEEAHFLFFLYFCICGDLTFLKLILFDIVQFGFIDVLALVGRSIHEYPHSHPDKAESTDNDKSHFPSPSLGEQWDRYGSDQSTDRSTGIKNGSCISAVFLREIFGCYFDSCREVTGLTKCKDTACSQETVHTYGSQHDNNVSGSGHQFGCAVHTYVLLGHDSAKCVHTSTCRPYADCPEIPFLGSHPVDKASGKQHANGIDNRKYGSDRTIVYLIPMKFRFDKFVPGQ